MDNLLDEFEYSGLTYDAKHLFVVMEIFDISVNKLKAYKMSGISEIWVSENHVLINNI